jgi:hypothetical protein
VFLGAAAGLLLGLAWRLRAWWLGWALVWLVVAPPGPTPAPILFLALGVALATWPPVRWAFSFLAGRGGMGGAMDKARKGETRAERRERLAREAAKLARLERVAWGEEPPPRRWAVDGLVPYGPRPRWRLARRWSFLRREERGFCTAVIGSGGTGKSYLLVDLALAALTGGAWLGRPVARVRNVLYCDSELDVDTMRERAWQVARGRGLTRPPGPARWWQLPWAWLRPRGLHYLSLPVSLATEEGQALVAAKAKACKADLILQDSLTIGSAGVALADADGWNLVLMGMEAWGRPTVVIDHTPKSGNGQVGSFMKGARIRSALELERKPDGTITVEHTKANFAALLPPWAVRPVFDLEAGAVRFDALDEHGHPLPVAPGAPRKKPARRWGKQEQLVLDAYAAHGPAVPLAIAERLRPVLGDQAEKVVWKATPKLLKGEALVEVGKVPPAGGVGRPAVRYAAVGQATTAELAVAQAERLLRSTHPGGAGGTAG